MPKLSILPHAALCPRGAVLEALAEVEAPPPAMAEAAEQPA